MNKYLCIFSHPFHPNKDGKHDLVIRLKSDPSSAIVPLYSHHEYETAPIGLASFTYTHISDYDETHNICFISGFIMSNTPLVVGQGLSIAAPLLETVSRYDVLGEIVEVSLVDVPHVPNCRIIGEEDVETELLALYRLAPDFVDQFAREMKHSQPSNTPQTV
jgi:hypothetical protein